MHTTDDVFILVMMCVYHRADINSSALSSISIVVLLLATREAVKCYAVVAVYFLLAIDHPTFDNAIDFFVY